MYTLFFSTQIYTTYFQIRLFLSKVNDPKLTVNNVNQDSLSFYHSIIFYKQSIYSES